MKKLLFIGLFLTVALLTVSAQGLYLDAGIGLGYPTTRIEGNNLSDGFSFGIGFELGLKAGYGPIADLPLYAVGAFGAMGHRFSDNRNWVLYNSYLFGPGVLYYPIPLVQLAATVGYSFTNSYASQSLQRWDFVDGRGFGFDVSAAVDLGKGDHGALIGLRYFAVFNTSTSDWGNESIRKSLISVFGRYTFRQKLER